MGGWSSIKRKLSAGSLALSKMSRPKITMENSLGLHRPLSGRSQGKLRIIMRIPLMALGILNINCKWFLSSLLLRAWKIMRLAKLMPKVVIGLLLGRRQKRYLNLGRRINTKAVVIMEN
jgi:hypothetical protein